jgi:hypothetical protein
VRVCHPSCLLALVVLGRTLPAGAQEAARPEPAIADNSFFIEEAYNQEAGVVQHINTFAAAGPSNADLIYTLTQEWPFHGQRHQLSYTVPVIRHQGASGGIGDVLLNYRLQLVAGERSWAVAPRLSAVLPTGSVRRGMGDGTLGVQVNLPLSWQVSSSVVTHWNAGATLLPRAQGPRLGGARVKRTLTSYNLGASVIAPTQWPVQLLVESVVSFESAIGAAGQADRSTSRIVSPGFRAAINLGSVQVVPGFAVPFTRSGGRTDTDLFFYLSFEHPFRRLPAE